MNEPQKADGEKESEWPSELRIGSGEEFRQSLAVAQVAVKLCELKIAQSRVPLEKENFTPEKFLVEAWELIQSARERVLRPQTNKEDLSAHGGSDEAMGEVVGRKRQPNVPFEQLCDSKRNEGDREIIKLRDDVTGKTIEVEWRVYTTKKAFDKLFWDHWRAKSILTDNNKWKEYGDALLASWKKNGLPPNTFLALAKFRREHDKRALNLKKKPKRRVKRATAYGRTVQRTRRAH